MDKIISLGIDELRRDVFHPHTKSNELELYYLNKPYGSLWGSTYTPDDKYVSDWERWADGEDFAHYTYGIVYELKRDARVYTIDSLDDFVELLKMYPFPDPMYRDINIRQIARLYLDFCKLMGDYDAIHLTHNGNAETHLIWNYPEIDVAGKKYGITNLNSWDVESWLILNFDSIDLDSVELYEKKTYKSNGARRNAAVCCK